MKNYLILAAIAFVALSACKEKNKTEEEIPISAVSIIKGQLKHLDSSLYQIMKIESRNGNPDTTFIKREDIRKYAASFLDLPDIANDDYHKNYTEDRLIVAETQTLNIISTAERRNAEIQKQVIITDLTDLANGRVQSIYIDRYKSAGDSAIQLKLFWEIDKSFSIDSIIQKDDQPERFHRIKVEWQ